jgi:hypothetical membrane protein
VRYLSGAALVCALLAPILVIGGSVLAAARQPPGYDPVHETLSVLASMGATDRWIMTGTLVVAGLAYVVVGIGLTGVTVAARVVIALAGAAVALAGLFAQPVGGSSPWHMGSAAVAWIAFTSWPLVVCPRPARPGLLSLRTTWLVTTVLLCLMGWFFVQLLTDGLHLGLVERILVVAQTLWPAAVVFTYRHNLARAPVMVPGVERVTG